jgi:hypothetical protein
MVVFGTATIAVTRDQIEPKLITPKLISHIKGLSTCIFEGLSDSTTDKITTNVIDDFNAKIVDPQFSEIINVLDGDFKIFVFDDADRDDLKSNVNGLNWQTSYKLFTRVFSAGSKYMTVHQAKGLEWKKGIMLPVAALKKIYTFICLMVLADALLKPL